MRVLQLTPLCRRFREQVEEGRVPLDDSVSLLVDASFLVFAKAQWLLPQSTVIADEGIEEEWIEQTDEFQETPPLLDEPEFSAATGVVDGMLQRSRLLFGRGYTTPIDEVGHIETAAIEALELVEAMESLLAGMKPRERTVMVLRRNFSDHMKWFWKEVTRLASRYTVLRFSLFMSSQPQDSVLNFLVLLELVKRRRLFARQRDIFGDILFSTKRDTMAKLHERS